MHPIPLNPRHLKNARDLLYSTLNLWRTTDAA